MVTLVVIDVVRFLLTNRSWANLMKEEEWETCVKRDEFKRMIVGLLFFHANIQVTENTLERPVPALIKRTDVVARQYEELVRSR